MANNFSGDRTNQALARLALAKLTQPLAPVGLFSTNFSEAIDVRGGNVIVQLPTSAGGLKTNPTDFNVSHITGSSVTVGLELLAVPFNIGLSDGLNGNELETYVEQAVNDFSTGIKGKFNELISSSYYTNTIVSASAASFSGTNAKTVYGSLRYTRPSDRVLVLDGAAYAALLPTDLNGFKAEDGMMKGAFGFKAVVEDNYWTDVAQTGCYGFGAGKEAFAVAARQFNIPQEGKSQVNVSYMTLPNGLPFGLFTWFNSQAMVRQAMIATLFGVERGQANSLTIIKS